MKRTLLLLSISGIIFSCQKDFTPSTPDTPVITNNNDSTTLSMYIDLDTTQSQGNDTVVVHRYSYDNSKRLIKSENTEYDGRYPNYSQTIYASYNGTDTIPFRKVEIDFDIASGQVDIDDTAYHFFSNGKLIYDSTILNDAGNEPYYSVKNFSYQVNNIKDVQTDYDQYGNFSSASSNNVFTTKTNGNTTSTIDSFYISSSLANYGTYLISYDDKKNPFYNLTETFLDKSEPFYNGDGIYGEDMIHEKNNPIDVNCVMCGDHTSYTYEYNLNGFPTVARYIDKNDPTIFYKRIFIYTKL